MAAGVSEAPPGPGGPSESRGDHDFLSFLPKVSLRRLLQVEAAAAGGPETCCRALENISFPLVVVSVSDAEGGARRRL